MTQPAATSCPSAISTRPLAASFFRRSAAELAPALLGRLLLHDSADGLCAGIIVETEAYDSSEPASHSFNGPTARNRAMFGPAGRAYVYRSYGVHWCVNVVADQIDVGAAVLLRAVEPIAGLELMRARRQLEAHTSARQLARGPGRLTQAMGITIAHDGLPLASGPLWIANPAGRFCTPVIKATPRIGISKATQLPWRYCIEGSPWVSGPKRWR